MSSIVIQIIKSNNSYLIITKLQTFNDCHNFSTPAVNTLLSRLGQRLNPVQFHQLNHVPPQVSVALPPQVTEPS